MGQVEQGAGPIGDGKDQIGLEHQGNGDQQDMEGIGQDHLGLGTEDDAQGQQQSPGGGLIEFVDKDLVEIGFPFLADYRDPGQDASCQGNHHKQENAQEQDAVGDGYVGYTQEKLYNGDKGRQDDQIIGGHLDHRIGRISMGQGAPHKDHGGAGGRAQEDGSGQILGGQISGNEGLENMVKEKGRQDVHGEGFDQPVCDPGDEQSLGMAPHFPDTLEIHLHHHGINHDPDQDGNGDGDPVDLEPVQEPGHSRQEMAHQYTGHHTEKHPQRKISLERADTRLFFFRHYI